MPSPEIEQLPAYLLGLLEEEERDRLEGALAADAGLRRALEELRRQAAVWGADTADHPGEEALSRALAGRLGAAATAQVLGHTLECEDCRFAARTLRPQGSLSVDPGGLRRRRGRGLHGWQAILAAAAMVAVAFVAGYAFRPAARSPSTAESFAVELRATRSGDTAEPTVRLSEVEFDEVSLIVETRLPAGRSTWELANRESGPVAGGILELGGSAEPSLRRLAFSVPKDRLQPGRFVMRIRSADGATDNAWTVSVVR